MPGIRRLSAVATVGVLAVVTFGIWSGVRPAAAWAGSAPTIGPVQISALGRPGLCWEAGGNGSPPGPHSEHGYHRGARRARDRPAVPVIVDSVVDNSGAHQPAGRPPARQGRRARPEAVRSCRPAP